MVNPLLPNSSPAPLEGAALNAFLQGWVVGITGVDGSLVRPRWQGEPPNLPVAGTAWIALGVAARRADRFPYVDIPQRGTSQDPIFNLQRNEELDLLLSFYDLGTNGEADYYAALFRDGTAIPQNRELLFLNGFGLVDVGDSVAVPVLTQKRWLYRVDQRTTLRRMIQRTYAVNTVLSLDGELLANDASDNVIERDLSTTPP